MLSTCTRLGGRNALGHTVKTQAQQHDEKKLESEMCQDMQVNLSHITKKKIKKNLQLTFPGAAWKHFCPRNKNMYLTKPKRGGPRFR